MADEAEDTSTESASEEAIAEKPQEDPIKNAKAEMDRKITNLQSENKAQLDQMAAILAEVQKSLQPKAEPRKSAKELIFDDPESLLADVEERATRRATEAVTQQYQASQAVQLAVSSLQVQYPEFSQDGSEAAILAVAKAAKLPAKLKGTAEGARLAMLEAAQELGLMPQSKRQKSESKNEEPIGSRSSNGAANRKPASNTKVDDKTRAVAELLGLDFNDPKQVAALEKASTRKSWGKYE